MIIKTIFLLIVLPFILFSLVFKIANDIHKEDTINAYKENAYWEELCSPYANDSLSSSYLTPLNTKENLPNNCNGL